MAVFNKFQTFVGDLGLKIHNLNVDTLKVYLTNAVPDAALDSVKLDLAEITAENGYPAGGSDVQNAYAEAAGVGSLTGVDIVFTAAAGSFGPFRYAILYNDDPVAPVDPLIGWWDYGAAVTTLDGETFTVDFGANILQLS